MTNASGLRAGLQGDAANTIAHCPTRQIIHQQWKSCKHHQIFSYTSELSTITMGFTPPLTMNSRVKSDTVRFKLSWDTVVLALYLIAVWVRDIHEVYTGEYMISGHPELNIQHLQPLIHPHPYSNTPHLSPEIHHFYMTITPIFILAMLCGVVFLSHRVGQPHIGVDFYWSQGPSMVLCRPARVSNGKHM